MVFGPGANVFFNGEFIPGFQVKTNANPALTFEKRTELNFGIDFGFAGNRFQGSLDFWNATTQIT